MKVSIIGGGGLVGSSAGYALQCGGVVREIALLDLNAEAAEGHALDLLHGGPSTADQKIVSGGYEHIPDSDVICITAGLRRKPDESRLDLITRNTIRFRSLIAQELDVAPTQLSALILGEHGESMVPIWSSATFAGLPLDKHPSWTANLANDLFARTRGSGAEVISKKGGAGFAVGIAIRDVIESIALDSQLVLPVSSVQEGCYGIRDVALSVPTVVGAAGVVDRLEFDLWPKEAQGLRNSGNALRETLATVLTRVG